MRYMQGPDTPGDNPASGHHSTKHNLTAFVTATVTARIIAPIRNLLRMYTWYTCQILHMYLDLTITVVCPDVLPEAARVDAQRV